MRLHISNVGHIVPVKSRALQGGGGEPLTLFGFRREQALPYFLPSL